jgi:hypothetical protein
MAADQPSAQSERQIQPPTFVSGGKRLNFDRHEPYGFGALSDTFTGFGKAEGTYPSCSWEELCAMAKLIVDHPAFRLPEPTDYYPPRIDDAR